jgi:hypothetical protein
LELTETDNDFYWNIETEETKWHRMAKVHNILERWQGSQTVYRMGWLHCNCRKDYPCDQHCEKRTFVDDELKIKMSSELDKLTVIQREVGSILHLTALLTMSIGLKLNGDLNNLKDSEDD